MLPAPPLQLLQHYEHQACSVFGDNVIENKQSYARCVITVQLTAQDALCGIMATDSCLAVLLAVLL
jgi:hypothetical protein